MDLQVSHSRIVKYTTCPKQYYYRYVEGWKETPAPENLILGSMVHDGVKKLTDGVPLADVVEGLHGYYLEPYGDKAESIKAMASKVIKVVQPKLRDYKMIFSERQLVTQNILGIIDFYAETEDGKKIVLDWKTASADYESHTKMLAGQLTMYQILLETNGMDVDLLAFGVITKGAFPTFRLHQTERRTKTEIEEYFKKVNIIERGILAEEFPKYEGYHCKWCPYLSICTGKEPKGITKDDVEILLSERD